EAGDYEGRFISSWIGFNALYGRLDEQLEPLGDRKAMGEFLSKIWHLDHDGHIRRVLNNKQMPILRLIDDKYLMTAFWTQGERAAKQAGKESGEANVLFGTSKMFPVFRWLFDRLYVMRVQVFHGASTKGSSLNRRPLQRSATVLMALLREFLSVMIGRGVREEWGAVCFSPDP
ncbi:MAG: hypothetical protein IIB55_06860, partial [Planctomycetes bacterium]|nr:hypothetical protein [Planctomycetota bacterium]